MCEHCHQFLNDYNKPEIWSLSNIIPVPKSGDLSKTDNYRGISLTCIIAKMVNSMILNRIRDAIDPHLRDNQNGFRKGRSTVGQILALRRIIEEMKNNFTAVGDEEEQPHSSTLSLTSKRLVIQFTEE